MEIAINTIDREPNYLFATLESLWRSGSSPTPVKLLVGSPSESYLDPLRKDSRVEIVPMNSELWERIKNFGSWQRRVGNLLATLQQCGLNGQDILICEDDIEFKPGWFQILKELSEDKKDAFINMYSTLNFSEADKQEKSREYIKPIYPAFGLLGMFVPSSHRANLTWYVNKRLGPWCIGADDLVVEYINEHDTRLFTTVPSQVDHRGDISSIPENRTHGLRRAPSF